METVNCLCGRQIEVGSYPIRWFQCSCGKRFIFTAAGFVSVPAEDAKPRVSSMKCVKCPRDIPDSITGHGYQCPCGQTYYALAGKGLRPVTTEKYVREIYHNETKYPLVSPSGLPMSH